MKSFLFTIVNELLVDAPVSGDSYDWFRLLLDDEILELVIQETNRYAVEVLASQRAGEMCCQKLMNEKI